MERPVQCCAGLTNCAQGRARALQSYEASMRCFQYSNWPSHCQAAWSLGGEGLLEMGKAFA